MRYIARALVLVVALAVAGSAFAATNAAQASSAPQAAKKTTAASHTVKGTVKSLDNSTLVLTPKKGLPSRSRRRSRPRQRRIGIGASCSTSAVYAPTKRSSIRCGSRTLSSTPEP